MIAYDKLGQVFALTEGPELLLHDGDSEGPLWRKTLDAPIVGLGINSERVVAVTESGLVMSFSAQRGDQLSTARLSAPVHGACVDIKADRIVAITEREVVELTAGVAKTLAEHGAHAIALAPDGSVLVATASELVALSGSRTTTALAGVRALAHHPSGFWVVGLAAKLLRWDGNGELTHITNLPPGSQVEHLACSKRALAISWGRHMVAVIEWPNKDTLGSLQYLEKHVHGLDFGPWPWLGVALDEGDGNKFHLETAALHRSDTHPGRQHHSWLVSVSGGLKKPTPAREAPRTASPSGSASAFGVLLALAAIALVIFFVMR